MSTPVAGGGRSGTGGFARSTGTAVLRGALLLAVAFAIGVVLLQSADEGGQEGLRTVAPGAPPTTATTAPPATTTTQVLRPQAQVKVLAANGTGVRGLASQYRDRLRALGYNVLAPTDTQRKPIAASVVYFTPGFEGEARRLAGELGFPAAAVRPLPQPPPVANPQGANLLVVIGQDRAGTATTTTRPRTATTGRPSATTTAAKPTTTTGG